MPDGEKRFGNTGSGNPAEVFGQRQALCGRHNAIFRITAACNQRANLLSRLDTCHACTKGDDITGNFKAWDICDAFRRRVKPAALQKVGTVNAGGPDTHQYFAGTRLRYGTFFGDELLALNDGHGHIGG